jgi:hypothetical protein
MLQVSRPKTAPQKLQLPRVVTEGGLSEKHVPIPDSPVVEKRVEATSPLSFIQTFLESGKVFSVKTLRSRASFSVPADEAVRAAWRTSFGYVAMIGVAIFLFAWIVSRKSNIRGWLHSKWLSARTIQKNAALRSVDLPKPYSNEPDVDVGIFQEPHIPLTSCSFTMNLTQPTGLGSTKSLAFNISRRPADGPAIWAMVTCNPEGNVWAKLELMIDADGGAGLTLPLSSCCLVHSAPDAESSNMQGAMMSWLSLLLNEKNEAACVNSVSSTDSPIDSEDESRTTHSRDSPSRACVYGMAEDLLGSNMRLEVRDGYGVPIGNLEATSKGGFYLLTKLRKPIFEIEAQPNSRSITASKNGDVVACATRFGIRNPELPELTGEEDEYFQVDISEGPDWSETVSLLTSMLAMIVFKPKASTTM